LALVTNRILVGFILTEFNKFHYVLMIEPGCDFCLEVESSDMRFVPLID
jgi:hypothetical protein